MIVQFTDTSIGDPTSWLWDFGDTVTSTQQNPSHVYLNPGLYTVILTVTNSLGSDTTIKTNFITVHFVACKQKYNYIFVRPTLKTWDNAPPESNINFSIMAFKGYAINSFPTEAGIKVTS